MKKSIAKVIALTTMASVQAAWASEQTVGTTNVVVDVPSRAVIVSCQMRPTDPTIMDVVYRVESAAEKVKVRALAFKDGVRDFAHVLRPETFIEGTSTNIGDAIAANVEHTLSWRVTADWDEDIGNVSFEVVSTASATNSFVLPYMYRDETRTGEREYYVFSPSFTIQRQYNWDSSDASMDLMRRNVLFWFYACNDSSLNLANGVLYWEKEDGTAMLPLCAGDSSNDFSDGGNYNLKSAHVGINIYRDGSGMYYYDDYYGQNYDFSLLDGEYENSRYGIKFPLADVLVYCIPQNSRDYCKISRRKVFNAFLKDKFSQSFGFDCEIHDSCVDEVDW